MSASTSTRCVCCKRDIENASSFANALTLAHRWDSCLDGPVCDDCRVQLRAADGWLKHCGIKSCTKVMNGRIAA